MDFKILGDISNVETIAVGRGIRELRRLQRTHGPGRWRKRKGVARVLCLSNEGYEASLEPRKIYASIADADAAKEDQLRVSRTPRINSGASGRPSCV